MSFATKPTVNLFHLAAALMPTPIRDVQSTEATTLHQRHLRPASISMAVLVTKLHRLVITLTTRHTTATTGLYSRQLRMFRTLRGLEWLRNTGEVRLMRPCTRLLATT